MKYAFIAWVFLCPLAGLAQSPIDDTFTETLDLDSLQRSGISDLEVIAGYGEGTDNFRLAANWSFFTTNLRNGAWTLTGNLAANYSQFEGTVRDSELRDAGLTPVWRFIPNHLASWYFQPFVEMGIGFHYLTEKELPTKNFSTHFQFGDHIGFGVRYGHARRHRITYQFQHLSNGGIDAPNPGINFHLVSMGYRFGAR